MENTQVGLCGCGCGGKTTIPSFNSRATDTVRGRPRKFLSEHSNKTRINHGHKRRGMGTPEYFSWEAMIQRCTNPNHRAFKHYGGRGIQICARWLTFENFLADMGPRPEDKTLDRYPNNDGNYEPGNCRWATKKEQANNRRNVKQAAPSFLA